MLGRSYAALGKQSLHHQSVAEMYSLLGSRVAALQQFELARRANDADYYTMSEIDARIRELQVQIKREREALRESASNQTGEPRQQQR
jgi:predicted Zn-dependent protease